MFDILIFAVIIVFMWKGYERRFEREFPRVVSLAVAMIFGLIFYEVLAALISITHLSEFLGGLTSASFLDKVSGTGTGAASDTVNHIFGALTTEKDKTSVIGDFLVKFIAFLILFFAAYFILRKVFRRVRFFNKIKVVRQVSPALGGLVGLLRGIVYIYIALALLVVCEPLMRTDFVKIKIEESQLARAMYEDNYIANIVAQRDFLSSEQ